MTATATLPELRYAGRAMDMTASGFAGLRRSDDARTHPEEMRARLEADGYIYLPGELRREDVLAARHSLLDRLAAEGALDPAQPRAEGVARAGLRMAFRADLVVGDPAVEHVLYGGPMMAIFEDLFGAPARHFDYTWLRAKSPGADTMTQPHCDAVYMSRGTPRLLTAWTPLGDVPLEMGGLMILEGSHRRADRLSEYWKMDVDAYCTNHPEAAAIESGTLTWQTTKQGGSYHPDAIALRRELGGRWLSAAYRAGDVLIFGMRTMHGSSDNLTNRIRLSTDSRYQPAAEPADERWIGPTPIAHGVKSKLGMIC